MIFTQLGEIVGALADIHHSAASSCSFIRDANLTLRNASHTAYSTWSLCRVKRLQRERTIFGDLFNPRLRNLRHKELAPTWWVSKFTIEGKHNFNCFTSLSESPVRGVECGRGVNVSWGRATTGSIFSSIASFDCNGKQIEMLNDLNQLESLRKSPDGSTMYLIMEWFLMNSTNASAGLLRRTW